MHGFGAENWEQRWHMWPVHGNSTTVATDLSSTDFFLQDGRKIHVGDCALFKPPKDSPPFIGIIRRLKLDKEGNCNLVVNWLYRPADIKLAKGNLTDSALNEVFYSFHKDEISAASLLHLCKVAFLCKGVELPSGISSFVCRRVYDTDHKFLWWLTDRDYINERQEEVDQLLDKTKLEMHGALQSGGRSPKPLNGPTSASHSKSGSDSIHNSSLFTSQSKGKKRERADRGFEPAKQKRLSRNDDEGFGTFRTENMLKSEIAKITDKGGLADFEGVEKFVKLMQPDSGDKRINLAGRMMLVDVIAITDRFDCLNWYLMLGGLPVLDEWLQEVHRGKLSDGSGLKESDKSVEDFLFALLRALDKLPVNLHTLQTCNVGKSVNNLRSHKNLEIQRKARSLVDTWKKRVKEEMNINEQKSGSSPSVSWPAKSASSEVSHVGNQKAGVSAEGGSKNSASQPSMSKHPQVKVSTNEAVVKSLPSPGVMKSILKDQSFRMSVGAGTSDLPSTPRKEERSSSSSHSQNNSQSSGHAKTVASSREDARSSTAVSGSVNKVSRSASHQRKFSSGSATNFSGFSRESGSGKANISNRNMSSKKAATVLHDKLPDVQPPVDNGNSRLIVRIPNTGRSPARGATWTSYEDPSLSCGGTSPLEKPDNQDRRAKGRSDLSRGSIASDTILDLCPRKDGMAGSEESNPLSGDAQRDKNGENDEAPKEATKNMAASTGIIPRSGKSFEASLISMDALIDSCFKFSETNSSTSSGDDVGMNLLASVAAGEICRSNNVSPLASPGGNSPVTEEPVLPDNGRLKGLSGEVAQSQCEDDGGVRVCMPSEHVSSGGFLDRNESRHHDSLSLINSSGDKQDTAVGCTERTDDFSAQKTDSSITKSDIKPGELPPNTSPHVPSSRTGKEGTKVNGINQFVCQNEQAKSGSNKSQCTMADSKLKATPLLHEIKEADLGNERTPEDKMDTDSEATTTSPKVDEEADEKSLCLPSEVGVGNKPHEESSSGIATEQRPPLVTEIPLETMEVNMEDANMPSGSANLFDMELKGGIKNKKSELGKRENVDLGSVILYPTVDIPQENLEGKDAVARSSGVSASYLESPFITEKENERTEKSSGSKLDDNEMGEIKDKQDISANNIAAGQPVKLDFDLNEGIPVDDGSQCELVKVGDTGNSSNVQFPCSLPLPISIPSFASSITVASAAKGPVVPPENILQTIGEPGSKGSAATSALCPAEPRKSLEMANTGDAPVMDATASKRGTHQPLDFDLNVSDEGVLDELGPTDHGSGGLGFDLNKSDESPDIGQTSMSNSGAEISPLLWIPTLPPALSNGRGNVSRDIDLNNGPCLDEPGIEMPSHIQLHNANVPFPSSLTGVRVGPMELGNFSSWFPPGNSYPAVPAVPSIFPGRGEQSFVATSTGSQRILTPTTGTNSLYPTEIYRGPVLSSSPALAFPPANPFQYPGFPFETGFPLSSNSFPGGSTAYMDHSGRALCFPTIPSQLAGPGGVVSTTFPRPFITSLPTGSSPDGRKWGSQGLDLNVGPGCTDMEKRDERLPSALRQVPIPSSLGLVDEPIKMFQVGGVLMSKEPDSGLDPAERYIYKQSPWQ